MNYTNYFTWIILFSIICELCKLFYDINYFIRESYELHELFLLFLLEMAFLSLLYNIMIFIIQT